jgi:hypothetical protein
MAFKTAKKEFDSLNVSGSTAPKKLLPGEKCVASAATQLLPEHITAHAEHFISALRDAYGLIYRANDVPLFAERLWSLVKQHGVAVEKIMKWFYGNCLAWLTGNDDDLSPSPLGSEYDRLSRAIMIMPSTLRHFFRHLMMSRQADYRYDTRKGRKYCKALSLAQTLLMLKKGSPTVQEEITIEAKQKHRKAMGDLKLGLRTKYEQPAVITTSWADLNEEELDLNEVWPERLLSSERTRISGDRHRDEKFLMDEIDSIVDQVFKKADFKGKVPSLFPSFSAHVGYNRTKGGAPTAIHEIYKDCTRATGELMSMSYHPRCGVVENRDVFDNEKFWERVEDLCRKSKFEAEPVFLLEPLKVRTITKGPAIPYWVLRLVQKELFSQLSQHPTFQLIGKPIDDQTLLSLLGNEISEDEKYRSGDYSQATDRLRSFLSLHAWNSISKKTGMENFMRRMGAKALVGHRIIYKDETIQQQNGQLMGSPVSFIVLCIVNAAVCSLAEGSKLSLAEKRLCVNGDDCVMKFNDCQFERWKYYASLAGMEPSPGKCYSSRDWLQMNSELFVKMENGFKRIPFINFSLASPFLAKGGDRRHWTSYGACAREFVKGFTTHQKDKLLTVWIKRMKRHLLKDVPRDMPWGIPEHFGGLGLPVLESRVNEHLTFRGRKLLQYCYKLLTVDNKNPTISETPQVPEYCKRAQRRAGKFESFCLEKDENDMSVKCEQRFSKANPLLVPFMWQELATCSTTRMPREKGDESHKKFYKLLKSSKNFDEELVSLHDALEYKKLRVECVGGVDSLARTNRYVPRSMYTSLGNLSFLRKMH